MVEVVFKMNKYLIGYTEKTFFEDEKGKKVLMPEFIEICEIKSNLNKKEVLKQFLKKNEKRIKEKNLKIEIEQIKDISFNGMVNIFKGGGLR